MILIDLAYLSLIALLFPLLCIKSIFDKKLRTILIKRLFYPEALFKQVKSSSESIWIHGASVGEINLALNLIRGWKKEDPNQNFVLTANTPAGLAIAKKSKEVAAYLAPFDFSFYQKHFIKKFKIKGLVLIETEIWPNMIHQAAKVGSIAIVNGRLSDRHFKKYQKNKSFFRKSLSSISLILAGEEISKQRFKKLGVTEDKIKCWGNMKFNMAAEPPTDQIEKIKKEFNISPEDKIFLAGSIQPEEITPVVEAYQRACEEIPKLRLFIVPRHPEKLLLFKTELAKFNLSVFISSEMSYKVNDSSNQINLIDQLGVLRAWYKIADSVFVGGSLCDRGGQNMIEPASLKKAVAIGPYAVNFKQEVELLLKGNGLVIVNNSSELSHFIKLCFLSEDKVKELRKRAFKIVEKESGAMDKTINSLTKIF